MLYKSVVPDITPLSLCDARNPRHDEGYFSASFDKLYGQPMDFLSSAGYVLLVCLRWSM